jgi:hypothetical protein
MRLTTSILAFLDTLLLGLVVFMLNTYLVTGGTEMSGPTVTIIITTFLVADICLSAFVARKVYGQLGKKREHTSAYFVIALIVLIILLAVLRIPQYVV